MGWLGELHKICTDRGPTFWQGVHFHKNHRQLRVFYYERNGYILSEKKLDKEYKFVKPIFDTKKQKYNICWADFVVLLEDTVVAKVYLREAA